MSELERKAEAFRALHRTRPILVLVNAWDVASAALIARLPGCRAIATSSAGVANAHGYPDGERIPPDEMLDAVARIARAVAVPVTADLEAGYADPAATAHAAWAAGAVGLNLEDGEGTLDEHVERVRAARSAVPALVINARTDLYLLGRPDFDETVRRANAYLAAGADCAFVPGVTDAQTIGALTAAIDGPVNVLAMADTPRTRELERLGVARVSVGSGAMRAAAAFTVRFAREVMEEGRFDSLAGVVPSRELNDLLETAL